MEDLGIANSDDRNILMLGGGNRRPHSEGPAILSKKYGETSAFFLVILNGLSIL
jgi:hypothetical protein